MKNQELSTQLQRINAVFTRSHAACGESQEMSSHWAKYLCVLSAGFLENALREVYSVFVQNAAHEPVQKFAILQLSRIRNPKTKVFIDVTKSFKTSWAEELKNFVDKDGHREAIDSIMQNRHLIAHGNDSTITIARVRGYLDKAVSVVDFIERQCSS